MPDHVDPASRVEEAADNVGNAVDSDNVVPPPTDNPLSAMDEALTSPAADGKRSKRLPVIVLWLVALIVIVVDQVTKQWALSALSDGRHTALLGRALGLVLVRNPGAAFSFATGQTWIFALIASFVVAIIIRVSRNLASRSWAVALGLVLGGASSTTAATSWAMSPTSPSWRPPRASSFCPWEAGRSTAHGPVPWTTRRWRLPTDRPPQPTEALEPAEGIAPRRP